MTSLPARIVQLVVGLWLFGTGCAFTVEAGLGVEPWTVLAEGVARHTGIGVGWVTIVIGALVLLAWIPLRQRPGIGTVANILIVGTAMEVALGLIPDVTSLAWRIPMLALGIAVVALASGIYIGAHLGPGPRDGLMTGLHARFGWPHWAARLGIELSVLLAGWLLGGTVGVGTVAFAVLIGPLVHVALPWFDVRKRAERSTSVAVSGAGTPADPSQA